jgi:ferredoxin/flavodoxin---NADP+ reductase
VDPRDLPGEAIDPSTLSRVERTNLATFRGWADQIEQSGERTVHFHFWRSPTRVLGGAECVGLELASTASTSDRPETDALTLSAELVIRAIGYRSLPLPGVPFDHDAAVVPNAAGRVLDADATPMPGQYVTGWLKRGPTGIIGTNRSDADETVTALLEDMKNAPTPVADLEPIEALLAARDLAYTEFEGWLRIDSAEREAGPARGGARVKIADWDSLLRLAAIKK